MSKIKLDSANQDHCTYIFDQKLIIGKKFNEFNNQAIIIREPNIVETNKNCLTLFGKADSR